jgi:drug/metabolite transporter (DMT)-like permease
MNVTPYISLAMAMFFWTGTFIAGRILAASVPTPNAAFLGFAIATLAMVIFTRLNDGKISIPPRRQWLPLLLLGMTVLLYRLILKNQFNFLCRPSP